MVKTTKNSDDDNLFRDIENSDIAPNMTMKEMMFYPHGFLNMLEMYPEKRKLYDEDIIAVAKALTSFPDADDYDAPTEFQKTLIDKFFDYFKKRGNGLKDLLSPSEKGNKYYVVSKEGDGHDVYQSMQLTKLRYAFTTCEKNIFLKVVDVCQRFLSHSNLGVNCDLKVEDFKEAGKVPIITFPIKDILENNNTNYSWVKERLSDLHEKKFGLPGNKDWDFREATLFQRVMADKGSGKIGVILSVDFWEAFNNLECYKVIDVNVAKKFKSIYAERMYELLVGNKKDIIYDVKNLKLMFCLEDKYKNTGSFMTNAIKPAQKEMKELPECPFYFDYEIIYGARRKIEKLKFIVIDKAEQRDADAEKQYKMDFTSDTRLTEIVIEKIDECFNGKIDCTRTDVELKLKWAQRNLGVNELVDVIQSIKDTADELAAKGKITKSVEAFFIGSLEKYVEKYRKKEKDKHILKPQKTVQVQTPRDVSKWEENGYDYMLESFAKKLAKDSGRTFEDWVKTFDFEESQPGIWRHKKTV